MQQWPGLKVAVACRLHAAARSALKLGRIDPTDCTAADLVQVGVASANALWRGSPDVCHKTLRLAREAKLGWSPSRHFLFHAGVRNAIQAVLLVSVRLRQRWVRCRNGNGLVSFAPSTAHQILCRLPWTVLPAEIWLSLCGFLNRSDFDVP